MTPLVAIVVAIVAASLLWPATDSGPGASPSDPPDGSPGLSAATESAVSADRDGDFDLVLRSGKALYAPGDPIDVTAALTYRGPAASIEFLHDSSGPIMFSIRERVFGEINVGTISLLMTDRTTLRRSVPQEVAFTKGGGFSGDSPDAPKYREWLQDPVLRLPEGTWHLSATAGGATPAGDALFNLSTEITIVVDDDPTATPGHPPATESANKPIYGGADIGHIALQLKSERPTYEVGSAIGVSVWYWFMDGPEVVASHFQPEVALSIEQLDATDPQSVVVLTDSACTDLGVVTGMERHVEIGPRLITLLRADTVPSSFDDLFVNGHLQLPIGRWRISASVAGEFGRCSGGGAPYAISTSLEIHVIGHLN
jgi:hypothetical protein